MITRKTLSYMGVKSQKFPIDREDIYSVATRMLKYAVTAKMKAASDPENQAEWNLIEENLRSVDELLEESANTMRTIFKRGGYEW